MKKILLLLLVLFSITLNAQVTTTPTTFEANQPVTINFNKTGTALASYTGVIYAHIGVTVNGVDWQNVIGSWGNNTLQPALTQTGTSTYTLSIAPDLYTYFGVPTTSSITKICVVFRNAAGNAQNNQGTYINVGAFQASLSTPLVNSTTILTSGQSLPISASNSGGTANYTLLANGSFLSGSTGTTFSYTHTNITSNKSYELQVTMGTVTFSYKFIVIVDPGTQTVAMASGLEDGINYNPSDATKATLVLTAPGKDYVYVAGSFNNWQPNSSYAMKKDPTTDKFWLELSGLTSGVKYTYQYWVVDNTPTTGSPKLVRTGDPYSTLVLSSFDDPYIPAVSYPNMPAFPTASGQIREVTVLQTGQTPYAWSTATTNFVKPNKDNLIVYELLIRDFDSDRNFQDLIDKIDYLKSLKINAVQLMPVMEFEGNESWGYNTVFHMASDKRYGPPAKLKELIDLCHQNGIAVILDIALNHVFGRSPLERMWMLDTDGDGWANANANGERTTSESPYINLTPKHSYNVGSDINHFLTTGPGANMTLTYVTRTIQTWIQDYKVDGFRWDLTKGFTNSCTSGDEGCTNGYLSDRVAKLKQYADIQWSFDPNFLVIFEHLGSGGSSTEEYEWADYLRSGDTKGILQWRKMTDPYANLLKGSYSDLSGITEGVGSANMKYRFVGYAESHDEERVVYKALTETGQTQGNLFKIHQRLAAMGAVHLLVPGPKMIWHFGDLGWDRSLWTCNNGTVSYSAPDCKLDTKPQPQWTENWLGDANRSAIYNSWSRMINLKKTEDVFENGNFGWNFSQTGSPRLDIWTSTSQSASLSYAFVRTNFSDNTLNTSAGFPFTGTWYNLMDNSTVNVTDTNMNIAIETGGFRLYGNKQATLKSDEFTEMNFVNISPNPTSGYFTINAETSKLQIFTVTGQLVKSYEGNHSVTFQFNSNDLTNGVYIVKATDLNNREKTMKLIKQ